jgi:hypothetical protein
MTSLIVIIHIDVALSTWQQPARASFSLSTAKTFYKSKFIWVATALPKEVR